MHPIFGDCGHAERRKVKYLSLSFGLHKIVDILIKVLEKKTPKKEGLAESREILKALLEKASYNQKMCLKKGGAEELKGLLEKGKVEKAIDAASKCITHAVLDYYINTDYSLYPPPGFIEELSKITKNKED